MNAFCKYKNQLLGIVFGLSLSIIPSFFAISSTPLILKNDHSFYPYSYLDNGNPSGLYNDITALAINRMKESSANIELTPWHDSLAAVQSGKAQGLIGTIMLPEKRPWLTHYSLPIFEEEIIFICSAQHKKKKLKDFPADFKNMLIVHISDFDGWLNYEVRDTKYTSTVNFFEAPNVEVAFQMVQKGNVDCSVFERMSFKYFMKKFKMQVGDKGAPFVAMTFKKEFSYIGFNASGEDKQKVIAFKDEINIVLKTMRENGEIEAIKARYTD